MVVLEGQQATFPAHEDGEKEAEEEVQNEGEDKQGAGLVFLVPEHPDDGQEEGHDADDAGT